MSERRAAIRPIDVFHRLNGTFFPAGAYKWAMKILITLAALAVSPILFAQYSTGDLAGVEAKADDQRTPAPSIAEAATDHYNLAMERLQAGDARGALADLDRAITLQPRDAFALLSRSEAYFNLGENERAIADLWNILGIQTRGPVAEQALLRLGQNAMENSDPRSAEILFDRYVKIAPYEALPLCHRGIARAALHQNDLALEDLERAIELDPMLDKAHVNKAIILLRMGFRQEGCASLQQAHDLGDLSTQQMLLIHCDR